MATTVENFILRFKTEGTKAIDSAQKSVAGLKGGVKELGNEALGAAQGMGGLAGGVAQAGARLGPYGAAVGAAAAVTVGLAIAAMNTADELGDLSDATGVTAGKIRNFQESVMLAGGEAQTALAMISKLNVNIGEAATGNDAASKKFKELGIAVYDAFGEVRSTDAILSDVVTRLGQLEDASVRSKTQVELLGKAAAGVDFTKVTALSDALTDEQVARMTKYVDQWERFKIVMKYTAFDTFAQGLDLVTEALKRQANWMSAGYLYNEAASDKPAAQSKGVLKATPQYNPATGQLPAINKLLGPNPLNRPTLKVVPREAEKPKEKKTSSGPSAEEQQRARAAEALAQSQRRILRETAQYEIELAKANSDEIKAITIERDHDIAAATSEIQSNNLLSQEQKVKEIAAVTKTIRLRAEQDILKVQERQKEALRNILQLIRDAGAEEVGAIRDRLSTIGMTSMQIDHLRAEQRLLDARNKAYEEFSKQLKDASANQRMFAFTSSEAWREWEKQQAALKKAQEEEKAAMADPKNGLKQVMAQMAEMTSPMQVAADQTMSLFNNMSSAIDEFVRTGKFKFADFAKSVIRDLIAIQMKAAAVELLNAVLGKIFKVPTGKAVGGNVNANTPYMVGERGPELFMPSSSGKIIANNALGAGSSGSTQNQPVIHTTQVNYNINAVDALSFRQMVARDPEFIYNVTEVGKRKQPTGRGR